MCESGFCVEVEKMYEAEDSMGKLIGYLKNKTYELEKLKGEDNWIDYLEYNRILRNIKYTITTEYKEII